MSNAMYKADDSMEQPTRRLADPQIGSVQVCFLTHSVNQVSFMQYFMSSLQPWQSSSPQK